MKIKLPEFRSFDEDSMGEYCGEDGYYFYEKYPDNDFPFDCRIEFFEGCDKCIMYGFIAVDDADVVKTDDFIVEEENKKPKVDSIERIYNLIVNQLSERYTKWIMENIMEEN